MVENLTYILPAIWALIMLFYVYWPEPKKVQTKELPPLETPRQIRDRIYKQEWLDLIEFEQEFARKTGLKAQPPTVEDAKESLTLRNMILSNEVILPWSHKLQDTMGGEVLISSHDGKRMDTRKMMVTDVARRKMGVELPAPPPKSSAQPLTGRAMYTYGAGIYAGLYDKPLSRANKSTGAQWIEDEITNHIQKMATVHKLGLDKTIINGTREGKYRTGEMYRRYSDDATTMRNLRILADNWDAGGRDTIDLTKQ